MSGGRLYKRYSFYEKPRKFLINFCAKKWGSSQPFKRNFRAKQCWKSVRERRQFYIKNPFKWNFWKKQKFLQMMRAGSILQKKFLLTKFLKIAVISEGVSILQKKSLKTKCMKSSKFCSKKRGGKFLKRNPFKRIFWKHQNFAQKCYIQNSKNPYPHMDCICQFCSKKWGRVNFQKEIPL